MVQTFFKVAFRNLWKYKSQTLISVIGLAVGFSCFALAMLWIRYEMSFDSAHKNAKQLYVVSTKGLVLSQTGFSKESVYPLAENLKKTFPEVINATPIDPVSTGNVANVGGVNIPSVVLSVNASFFQLFDVIIIEGRVHSEKYF